MCGRSLPHITGYYLVLDCRRARTSQAVHSIAQWVIYNCLPLTASPGFGDSASAQSHAISFEFTYSRPVSGSNAGPPHSAPPSMPGNATVSLPTVAGTNGPPLIIFRSCANTAACAWGVRVVSMSSVRISLAKGAGLVGTG